MTTPRRRKAFTLMELVIFGAIGALVLAAMIALFSRGSKLTELGRRSSASMEELRVVLEHLTRDIEELAYLEEPVTFDSDKGADSFAFVARSSDEEIGIADQKKVTLRKIEYRLGPPSGDDKLRSCERIVNIPATKDVQAAKTERRIASKIRRLRVEPLASVPRQPPLPNAPLYFLVNSDDPAAKEPGAAVICLLVDLEVGQPAGDKDIEKTSAVAVATKLWCRDRLLELPRGGKQ